MENIVSAKEMETDVKCVNCGAAVRFDPDTGKLKCGYCGTLQEIEYEDVELVENDYEAAISEGKEKLQVHMGQTAIQCKSCGAVTVFETNTQSSVCPFCGSNMIVKNEAGEDMLRPSHLIPFRISEEKVKEGYAYWIKKRWFAPKRAMRKAGLEQIQGIYVPFYTFDFNTVSDYDAQSGIDHRAAVHRTVFEDGRSRQVTEYETHTDWTPVSGRYEKFFNDILVPCDKELDDKLLKKMGDYRHRELKPIHKGYMAGFGVKRYTIGLEEGFEKAKNKDFVAKEIEKGIKNHVCSKYNSDRVIVTSFYSMCENITFKHILMPMWISTYLIKGKKYCYLVNGQTGTAAGKRPVSVGKIIALALGVAAAVAALWILWPSIYVGIRII